ncbi:MAG: hypothetical protein R2762_15010 [Bryobacteraceae bacterium]
MSARLAIFLWAALMPAAAQPTRSSELEKAVSEFQIQTRNLGLRADSPRAARKTRSSPRWHGRLYENLRNDFLDAIPHEIAQRGGQKRLLRRNQFGFHVTGPVVIPKLYNGDRATFFSFTYEGVREKIERTYLRTIPTLLERTGDWAHVVDAAGNPLPIFDPASTAPNPAFSASQPVSRDNLQFNRAAFPANRIPASRLDKLAQEQLQQYPAPNTDAGPFFRNNFFIIAPEQNAADGIIARVDHTMRERHRIGFGLSFSNGLDGAAPWFPTAANPGSVPRDRRSRRASLEHVLTLSARSVNTVTFEAATDRSENLPLLGADGAPFPRYQFQPYLSMGRSYPQSRTARNTFVLSDGFSTRWQTHRFRVSGQLVREQVNSFWPQYPSGSFQFSAGLTSLPGIVNTGHAFASFLLGLADYAEQSVVQSPSYFRRTRFQVSLRDQWEVQPGLTLSAGMNLDTSGPRIEKYDRQSTVSLSATNPVNGRPGALVVAGRNGQGRGFQPFLVKAEPSAGISWNIRGSAKTVARASYARSYSQIPVYSGQWGTQAFNGTPTWVSPNPQLEPAVKLADGLTGSRTFPDLRPEAANDTQADLIEPTGRQPTYQSMSASIEREMPESITLTLGYGHADGRNLLLGNSGSNPNAIHLDALSFRDRLNDLQFNRSLRPFPQYQKFEVYSSWPEGRYRRDVGYLRLEKRTSGGLSLSAGYDFSKQMDNYSGPYGVQDYYNRANEWSLTSSNSPHRISLTYAYELPFGPNRRFLQNGDWLRFLVQGWSVSGVTTVASGAPVAPRPQFNNTGGVVDALRVSTVPGVDPAVASPGPDLWFNPAAFTQPADFTIGDAARTHPSLRLPGNQNHDLSLNKRFPLTAEQSLEFSAVGLNFVNHAVWNDPDMVIGSAAAPNVNAGKIVGSTGGRIIQLGLRFSF